MLERLLHERYAGIVAEQKLLCPACVRDGGAGELWASECHSTAAAAAASSGGGGSGSGTTGIRCAVCASLVSVADVVALRTAPPAPPAAAAEAGGADESKAPGALAPASASFEFISERAAHNSGQRQNK